MDPINLIRRIAWSFARRTGLPYDDLFAEACLAYVTALPRYDPSKAQLSTFVWHTIHYHLTGVSQAAHAETERITDLPTEPDWPDPGPTPEQALLAEERWAELMASLSAEARVVVQLTLEEAQHGLPIDRPKLSRGILSRKLRERGWSRARIRRSFGELRTALAG